MPALRFGSALQCGRAIVCALSLFCRILIQSQPPRVAVCCALPPVIAVRRRRVGQCGSAYLRAARWPQSPWRSWRWRQFEWGGRGKACGLQNERTNEARGEGPVGSASAHARPPSGNSGATGHSDCARTRVMPADARPPFRTYSAAAAHRPSAVENCAELVSLFSETAAKIASNMRVKK